MHYAGFWNRFAAALLDGIILYIISVLIGAAFGFFYAIIFKTVEGLHDIAVILGILINWLYYALMESSPKQATIGKQAMGIIVTDLNGNRISFGRATLRLFGKYISALILCIGYIMAAFTEKKQALHDMIANCLVVSKKSIDRKLV